MTHCVVCIWLACFYYVAILMKQIIFIRHGKAEEKWPKIDDWSRQLVEKWEQKTIKHITAIRDKITRVDAIISSWSWRCKMTAEIVALELWIERNMIQYHSGLRSDDYQALVWMIRSFPVSRKHVVVVWHNDSLSEGAMALTNAPLDSIVKSWLVGLSFSVEDWALVDKKNNSEVWQYNGE